MSNKVRIDKWIWSVRIFKSRTLATDACKAGKVKVNGTNAKPSTNVGLKDTVEVKKNGFTFTFRVVELLEKRVNATLAQASYENLTPAEELSKYSEWFVGKSGAEFRDRGTGRPTKKERREIDDYKDYQFDLDFFDEGD